MTNMLLLEGSVIIIKIRHISFIIRNIFSNLLESFISKLYMYY